MTESNDGVKLWLKAIIITLGILLIFWVGFNLTVILGAETIKDNNISDIVVGRYQNCSKMLAIIVPNIYALVFYYIFGVSDSYIILRYGRRRYEKVETLKIFICSVIFAFEYFFVDIVFMTAFGGIKLLIADSYYQFVFFRFIMMIFYVYLIGMTLFFLRNLLNFNKIYMLCGAGIYSFLGILYFAIQKAVSPAYCMDFSSKWFLENTFDSFTYIINLAKLFFASLILKYLGEIVFLRRDILGNEEN